MVKKTAALEEEIKTLIAEIIEVESAPGKGSVFTVILPYRTVGG